MGIVPIMIRRIEDTRQPALPLRGEDDVGLRAAL